MDIRHDKAVKEVKDDAVVEQWRVELVWSKDEGEKTDDPVQSRLSLKTLREISLQLLRPRVACREHPVFENEMSGPRRYRGSWGRGLYMYLPVLVGSYRNEPRAAAESV